VNIPSLSGLTFLIVEDAYLIALEAQQIVEDAGAKRVILASTVDDARTALASVAGIDICVLDLKLGEEDATQLIEHLRSLGVAVLVATGFDTTVPDIDAPLLKKPTRRRNSLRRYTRSSGTDADAPPCTDVRDRRTVLPPR
jgi:CheY-like chemotaxis protein